MTDNTIESFAFRLFKAIRANKKAIIEARPTLPMYADNYSQCQELASLIDALFSFEKYARGAQKALAGAYAANHFTQGRKCRDQNPDNDYQNFLQMTAGMANGIVRRMLDCQSLLVGSTWQRLLTLEGMHNGDFNSVAYGHINSRLPGLMTAIRQRSAQGFSVSFPGTFILKMEFVNGAAVNKREEQFPMPNVEGKTLEQQIVRLNQYWTEIKHFAREMAKTPTNWPSLLDSRNVELQNVTGLLTQFYRGLRPEQKALLQKYPAEVNQFFSQTM